jgi:acetamidase/formamidase
MPWWKKALRGASAIPGVGLVVGAGYAIAGEGELAADAVDITFTSTVKAITACTDISQPDLHRSSSSYDD